MTPLEAADYLRRRMHELPEVRTLVSAIVDREGYADMFDWADSAPEEIVLVAESFVDVVDQLDEFARRLSTGDLS